MEYVKDCLSKRISHVEKRAKEIKESHGWNPNETHNYYGGHHLGYYQGMLNAYQNVYDEKQYIPKKENCKTLIHWCDCCKSFYKCKADADKKNRRWCHTYIEENNDSKI